jgi:putative endonuclease
LNIPGPEGEPLAVVLNIKDMYTVYFLQSLKDNKFYIGCTSDIDMRVHYHNTGRNKSTKHRRPLKLVYIEEYKDKHEAYKREFYLKSPKGF